MKKSLPVGITIRPATLTDVQAVTDLLNECAKHDIGVADTSVANKLGIWQSPTFNVETDATLAFTPANQLVGYLEFETDTDLLNDYFVDVYIHPAFVDQGIGDHLLQLAENRVEQNGAKNQPVSLQTACWSIDESSKRLFETNDYKLIRHFWMMEIKIEQPPPPVLPEGITIRTFVQGQDEQLTWQIREQGFADMWGFNPQTYELWEHQFIKSATNFDPSLWFLAFEGDTPIAMCLNFPNRTEDPELGWIKSLAVLRPWRKRGVAMALLQHTFAEFYRRGRPRVGLAVDGSSLTGANRLYERAGMKIYRQTNVYEKQFLLET